MTPPFRLEQLSDQHDRVSFTCGDVALDLHLRTQATQDIRRRIASCLVAIEVATGRLAAYYTIASASVPLTELPPAVSKRLPRYPTLPAVRIGRLAVDQTFRAKGLGGALLADAIRRTLQAPPAVFTLLVDAKNEDAANFYRHHGFLPWINQPRTLFLPLATAIALLK